MIIYWSLDNVLDQLKDIPLFLNLIIIRTADISLSFYQLGCDEQKLCSQYIQAHMHVFLVHI